VIVAALSGARQPLSDGTLARMLAGYPLMTIRVFAGIHWHALRMFFRGFKVYRHPRRAMPGVPVPEPTDSGATSG
jgi:hypothetical protein